MRLVFLTLFNLLRSLWLLLELPGRLLRRKHRPAYIRYRLTGEPLYRKRGRRGLLSSFRSPRPEPATVTSLEVWREELELLAKDERVKGIVVEVENLAISPAKREAIAGLFGLLRAAGKEVVAYAVTAATHEYALLCEADRVWMSPAGRLELVGYAAEATALGSGLRRLGVTAHFIRRGDYKTAPELFTHETISPIQRQTIETLLDERYGDLVALIARRRKLSEEQIRRLIDEGPYSARRALAKGLVDLLCTQARIPDVLAGKPAQDPALDKDEKAGTSSPAGTKPAADAKPGDAKPGDAKPGDSKADKKAKDEDDEEGPSRLGNFASYAGSLVYPPNRKWRSGKRLTRLGMVPVNGIIGQGDGGFSPFGRVAGSDPIMRALRSAARDRRTKAILLFVNSPGGSAVASELVMEEVQRAARKKPVLAYFDQVAASGGYMVSLGAKEIWAAPQAIAGSIGVFAGKFDMSGLMERLGIHRLVITRGENAGLHSASRAFTEHERQALDADIEETYQAFLDMVARSRRMTKEAVHQRGEGRIYTGRAALEAGLVDGTCGFEEACRRALDLAGVKDGRFQLVPYRALPRRAPFPSNLFQLQPAQMFALWWPWLRLPGMEGSGEPG